MTLHLVFNEAGRQTCTKLLADDDITVLLGDSVYAYESTSSGSLPVLCLESDLSARGVDIPATAKIDYNQLVELCVQHKPVVSWSS